MGYSEAEVSNLKKAYDKAQAAISSSGGKSGGGGSWSGGSKKSGTQDTGILAAMYALGNDAAAYEYLVSLDLAAGKTDTLWDLYQSGGQTQSRDYSSILSKAAGLKDISAVQKYLDRMIDGGYITDEEAAHIFSVELGYNPSELEDVSATPGEQTHPSLYEKAAEAIHDPKKWNEFMFGRFK